MFAQMNATKITELGFIPTLRSGSTIPISGGYIAVGPTLVSGFLQPRYVVLTVVYAPPGTAGGKSTISVTYGSTSTTGTTTSVSNSFKNSVSVKEETSGSIFGNGGGLDFNFSHSTTSTDTSSVDIKKSITTTITRNGPGKDGIDHDEDQIYLWLNPVIDVAALQGGFTWHFDQSAPAVIQNVYVGDLKNPSQMAPGTKAVLNQYGVTEADFAGIAKHDPFSDAGYTIDQNRFVQLNFTIPYTPPYQPSDPVPGTFGHKLDNSSVDTTGHTAQDEYSVGVTVKGSAGFDDLIKAKLAVSDQWTWTNTTSINSSSGTDETASAQIGGPSYGWPGSTQIQVYYDTLYKTFEFEFVPVT